MFETSDKPFDRQGLCKLPGELQELIWRSIDPVDRTALALTSKSHAAVYADLKDRKVVRNGKLICRLPGPIRVVKTHRLQVLVRLRSWMPSELRLCYRCLQYVDIAQSRKGNDGGWGGNAHLVEGGLATAKAMKEGPRCPLCIQRQQLQVAQGMRTYKEYARTVSRIKGV